MTATPPGSLGLPLLGETLPFLKDPFEFELVRTRKHGPVWKTRILGSTVANVLLADADPQTIWA